MNTNEIQIRDPYIVLKDGEYYMFGTTDRDAWRGAGGGFDMYKSSDLSEWRGPFAAFRPTEDFWGKENFWAPEVHEYKGEYYMLASFIADGFKRGTAILKSPHPGARFEPWSDGAVTPPDWMCLDGTLYVDKNGDPWIVFCHEWVQIGDGTICAARLSDDLRRVISEPIELFASSAAPWSSKAFSPSNSIEGYVTDGCFMHRNGDGTLVMLWSCMGENGYCLSCAVSQSGEIDGPWQQSGAPLFDDDGGHGMIFRARDGRLLLTLHRPNKSPNERAVFIEVAETADGLRII